MSRTSAGCLYASGLLSLLLGLEGMTRAQSCTPRDYPSATCWTAHSGEPIESASQSYCEWVSNNCQEAVPSSCVDRWGIAYPGKCILDAIGTNITHTCYENSLKTLVNVRWYTASCKQNNGECNCVWEASLSSHPVEVCDCYDVEN